MATGGSLHVYGEATTTIVGPTYVNTGVTIASGEEGSVEVHVWSTDGLAAGSSYRRVRTAIAAGLLIGGRQPSTVYSAAGLGVDLDVNATNLRLVLTGIASSVRWYWWTEVNLKL